jgi:hypothetical protein
MSASDSSFMKVGQYGLNFKAFFIWSLAMAIKVLMIITMTISFGNNERKW